MDDFQYVVCLREEWQEDQIKSVAVYVGLFIWPWRRKDDPGLGSVILHKVRHVKSIPSSSPSILDVAAEGAGTLEGWELSGEIPRMLIPLPVRILACSEVGKAFFERLVQEREGKNNG